LSLLSLHLLQLVKSFETVTKHLLALEFKELLLFLKALVVSKILLSKTESSLALLFKAVLLYFKSTLPASKGRLDVARYLLTNIFGATARVLFL
jgi:hypothetical protein